MEKAIVRSLTGHEISGYEHEEVHRIANMNPSEARKHGYNIMEAKQRIGTGREENRIQAEQIKDKKESLNSQLKELDRLIKKHPETKRHKIITPFSRM